MGKSSDMLTRDVIASLQAEQAMASEIISDLSLNPVLTAEELWMELQLSTRRKRLLAHTQEQLILAGVTR